MMGKKILIMMLAIIAAVAGALGIAMNTRSAKVKRFMKRTGKTLYTVGTAMRTVSGMG